MATNDATESGRPAANEQVPGDTVPPAWVGRMDALEAKFDTLVGLLTEKAKPATPPPARAAGESQHSGAWRQAAEVDPLPTPEEAAPIAVAAATERLKGITDVAVTAREWRWEGKAEGPVEAMLVVAVEARATAQTIIQRRLKGGPGQTPDGDRGYTHAVLIDTGKMSDSGRRTDLYALFVPITAPARSDD